MKMLRLLKSKLQSIFRKQSKPLVKQQEASVVSLLDELRSQMPEPSIEDLRTFINRWNANYPIDRWWREKYKIPLNSESHRKAFILDMRLEWEEDMLYKGIRDRAKTKEDKYEVGRGDWLKKREVNKKPTVEEVDEMFDNIDVTKIEQGSDDKEIIL